MVHILVTVAVVKLMEQKYIVWAICRVSEKERYI